MGSRQTQIIGLNEWAERCVEGGKILLYRRQETRIYPDGRKEVVPEYDVFGPDVRVETLDTTFPGMFEGEEYPLHQYIFSDGRVVTECVQADQWSSGPCIFLALKDETGAWVPESLWPEEAIAEA